MEIVRRLRTAGLVLSLLVFASCGSSGGKDLITGPPAAPRNLTFSTVPEGVKITWEPVAGATRYTLFWGTETGKFNWLHDSPGNSIIVANLSRGDLYSFAVTSWNEGGESDYSEERVYVYDDDPARASAHLAKGSELIRKGSLVIAYAYISACIRLDPKNAEAYRMRASINEKMNRPEPARSDYKMAEKLLNGKQISLRGKDT